MKILKDDDLRPSAVIRMAIDALDAAFQARATGQMVSPPRHHVSFPGRGDIVFTVGGIDGERPLAGFRAYETFNGKEHSQVVVVWRADTAELQGIIMGERLGQIRTGAIGGVAIRHLSSPNASTVGVIGSGAQARTQLLAAASVRDITSACVFSPSPTNRAAFAEEMQAQLGFIVEPVAGAAEAVADADIVLCATSSNVPVVNALDLKAGVHINTVGPKTLNGHELDLDVADMANIIATDSPEQTRAYASPFFLSGSPHEQRMQDLAAIVAGRVRGRTSPLGTTLFCSVGLAGTEVVVASAIFDAI